MAVITVQEIMAEVPAISSETVAQRYIAAALQFVHDHGYTDDNEYRNILILQVVKVDHAFDGVQSFTDNGYIAVWQDVKRKLVQGNASHFQLAGATVPSTPSGGAPEVTAVNRTLDAAGVTLHFTWTDGTTTSLLIPWSSVTGLAITEYTNDRIAGNLTQQYGTSPIAFGRDHSGGGTPPPAPVKDTAYVWTSTSTNAVTSLPSDAVSGQFDRAATLPAIALRLPNVTSDSYLFVALPVAYAEPQVLAPGSIFPEELVPAQALSINNVNYHYWRTAGDTLRASVLSNGTVRLTA